MALFSFFKSFFESSSDNEPGVGAVLQAIDEREVLGSEEFQATLGEPKLRKRGIIFTEHFVTIPLSGVDGLPSPPDLEFELPENYDDLSGDLGTLLNELGYDDFSFLAEVEGETITVAIENGVPVPKYGE